MPFLNHIDFAKVQAAMTAGREFFGGADTAQLDEALASLKEAREGVASPELCATARNLHGSDDIEIDDDGAGTSVGNEGTWVQAWVYVPSPADGREIEEAGDDDEA